MKLAQVSVENWGMREGERRKEYKADMILRVVEMVEQSRETEEPSLRNCHFDRDLKRSVPLFSSLSAEKYSEWGENLNEPGVAKL